MNKRPSRTRPSGAIGAAALSGLLLVGLVGCAADEPRETAGAEQTTASAEPSADSADTLRAAFVGVVDGTTIEVQPQNDSGGPNGDPNVTVHLLGVAAPGADECGAAEAVDYLERMLLPGEPLDITYDPEMKGLEDADGNTWAYVHTVAGGARDVSRALVRDGYAAAWHPEGQTEPEQLDTYKAKEAEAESGAKGLWATCGGVAG